MKDAPEELLPGPRIHFDIATILLQALKDILCLAIRQKLVLFREVDDQEESEGGDKNGEHSFQNLEVVRDAISTFL